MVAAFKYVLQLLDQQLTFLLLGPTNLSGEMGTYLHELFNFAERILIDVAKPIAYTILALFFVLEIYRLSIRAEASGGGSGQLGVELIIKVLFRLVIFKVVIDKTPEIMKAIYNLTAYLTSKIAATSFSASSPPQIIDVDAVANHLSSVFPLNFLQIIVSIVMALLIYLVVLFATAIAYIVSYLRLIELYLYYALSPIPLATLPSEELSSAGKSFLKSFTAVSLQGSIIFLIMMFLPAIANNVFVGIGGASGLPIVDANKLSLAYLFIICWAVILMMALLQARQFANNLCQAI